MKPTSLLTASTVFVLALFFAGEHLAERAQAQADTAVELVVQDGSAQESAKTVTEQPIARRRLPNYYGQIGLTAEQRERIYGVQVKFRPEIRELQEKLQALQAAQRMQIEAVLTAEQKTKLETVRSAAAERRRMAAKKATEEVNPPAPKG